MYDLTFAGKYEVFGRGAAAWLDQLLASRLPRPGRSTLGYVLSPRGGIVCELTVTRSAEDHFYLVGPTVAERHCFDVLTKALPKDGSVRVRNVTSSFGALAIVGPRARDLLAALLDVDLSNAGFPWWSAKTVTVGLAAQVRALRMNYVGELGWELHHPIEYHNHLFDALISAGKTHGLALIGSRAIESLRMEKSYPAFWRDLAPEYTPSEAGLHRFIDMQKPCFVGRQALLARLDEGVSRKLAVLRMASKDTNPYQNETVYRDGAPVGRVTSAAHGHLVGDCLAHAYLGAPHATQGTRVEVSVLGKRRPALVVAPSPWDPGNDRPRS
jgi:dimethylglycine dehydrogenase